MTFNPLPLKTEAYSMGKRIFSNILPSWSWLSRMRQKEGIVRKRNTVQLSICCILSVWVLSGLLIYAFDQQQGSKAQSDINKDIAITPTEAPEQNAPREEAKPSAAPTKTPSPTVTPIPTEAPKEAIVLGFAGDVCLDEASGPVTKYMKEGHRILSLFSEDLLEEMKHADLMMINNEFAYSTRGKKEENKSFTFRAHPDRVKILEDMGVDIVSLANNHALDYGQDALIDTFRTLDIAGIDYVGAGETMSRAKAPIYKTVANKTIAYVAASRVIFDMSWYATDITPGMVGTYDPAIIVESIKEAKENSDFVVMFVHWGIERNSHPEKYQRKLAQAYIDAGADVVVGCHPHVMQGFEYYQGKLIAYSLGNYLFNNATKKSGMLKLYLSEDNSLKAQILPVMNKATKTYLLTDQRERSDYFNYMEGLSFGTLIDEEGYITEDIK
jgi:poly-gamma-glutamate capsule biosynthesis protein CapA/YwtB (metallophosphatase superfamily)